MITPANLLPALSLLLCLLGTTAEARELEPLLPEDFPGGANGMGTPEEYAEAKAGCDRSKAEACYRLAILQSTSDEAKAIPWYEKACAKGELRACFNLGLIFQRGWDVRGEMKWDLKRAEASFEKVCKGGILEGCYAQAWVLVEVTKTPTTREALDEAEALLAAACDHGHGSSCVDLAFWVEKGDQALGREPDPARATQLYRKACDISPGLYRQACRKSHE